MARGRPKGSKNKPKTDAAVAAPKRERKPKAAAQGTTTDHARTPVEAMTDEQEQVLFGQHKRAYDAALEKKKAAAADFLNVCKLAKAKIGAAAIEQMKLMHALETPEGQERLKERMAWQAKVARWQGMPIGHIDDLFTVDRQPIEDRMFDEGKRAGLNGETAKPPNGTTGHLHQEWMRGWHAGQEVLHANFKDAAPPKESEMAAGVIHEPGTDPDSYPEAQTYQAGFEHRKAGGGCSIPEALIGEDRETWHSGWRTADAEMSATRPPAESEDVPPAPTAAAERKIDWFEQGTRAFRNHEAGVPPDAVPEEHKPAWREGWSRARVSESRERNTVQREQHAAP